MRLTMVFLESESPISCAFKNWSSVKPLPVHSLGCRRVRRNWVVGSDGSEEVIGGEKGVKGIRKIEDG